MDKPKGFNTRDAVVSGEYYKPEIVDNTLARQNLEREKRLRDSFGLGYGGETYIQRELPPLPPSPPIVPPDTPGTNLQTEEPLQPRLPRFMPPHVAVAIYESAQVFDPVQTLFAHDPVYLNELERRKFFADPANIGKEFILPHDPTKPVIMGLPRKEGVDGLERVWREDKRNEMGAYVFDPVANAPHINAYYNAGLSSSEVYKEVLKLQHFPNMISDVSIQPTDENDKTLKTDRLPGGGERNYYPRNVSVSNTIGLGEQIIGDPRFFTFKGRKPL